MVSQNFKNAEYGIETHVSQPTFALICPSRAINYLSSQLRNREESLELGNFTPVTLGERNPFLFTNLLNERKTQQTWKAPITYSYEGSSFPFISSPTEEIEDHKAGYLFVQKGTVNGNEDEIYEAMKIGLRYELELKDKKVLPISTIKLTRQGAIWASEKQEGIITERRDHKREFNLWKMITQLDFEVGWQRTDLSSILPTEVLQD